MSMWTTQSARPDICQRVFSLAGRWQKRVLPIGSADDESAYRKSPLEVAFGYLPPTAFSRWLAVGGSQRDFSSQALPGRWHISATERNK